MCSGPRPDDATSAKTKETFQKILGEAGEEDVVRIQDDENIVPFAGVSVVIV